MNITINKFLKNLLNAFLVLSLLFFNIGSIAQTPPATTQPIQTPPPTNNTNNAETDKQVDNNNTTVPDNEKGEILDEYNESLDMVKANSKSLPKIDGLVIFGSEIFGNTYYANADVTNQPPPSSYVIGPNDKLRINVTGKSLVSWEPVVNGDGSIFLEGSGIGKIYVGGKNLDAATQHISNILRSYNFAIGNGTYVDVALVSIRSFSVNIVGEVEKPGTKLVNSFTSVLDALYLSGGININGSYRYIQVIRDGRIFIEVDLYDMLINGDFSNNIFLEENDIIRVPVYRSRVGIYGEVKRSAMFEIKQGEVLKDVLKFAGGFTEYAYSSMIKVRQVTDTEMRLRDIEYKDYDRFIPMNGDRYTVERVIDRVENRVSVQGQVFRPGAFELETTPTILDLINKAGGLKEEAFMNRAYLIRTNPIDNRMENIPIDLEGIVKGDKENIRLQREDVLNILSIYDLTDASTITIVGQVRNATTIPYYPGITIEDAILKANGFKDGADFMNVKISRRIHDSDRRSAKAKVAEVIDVTLDPYLTVSDRNIKLEPYDVVYVYPYMGYSKPITVSVEGEVLIPGEYPMMQKNNRISDLVKRAGGVNELANIKGATLYRVDVNSTKNEVIIDQFQKVSRDASNFSSIIEQGSEITSSDQKLINNKYLLQPSIVSIDLEYILKHPGSKKDLILQEGDRLSIPTIKNTITIKGYVGMPTMAIYEPGKSLISYINNDAGGFSEFGFRRKTQVHYPNGRVKVKGFFSGFPRLEPGCEIYVPYKKPREKQAFNYQSIIAVTSSISSTVAIVFAIIRLNNN